jgi:nucleoside-diphosphate-sugar epimerase
MKKINEESPVLVTGGNGFIASWIIKMLLEEGKTVHATVRDPNNREKVGHLTDLAEKNPGTLKLFKANLLEQGSFDEPMKGCELVMHTASPFTITATKKPYDTFVKPALDGTRNVLESVKKTPEVKRVVLTSSCAAIYGDNADLEKTTDGIFTEEYWNTSSSVEHNAYSYSKTVAEREAWEIHKGIDRWDLVTINPSMVLGPSLTKSSNSGSLDTFRQIANGSFKTGAPHLAFGFVDVRDVAAAHIKAGYNTDANGRYILSGTEKNLLEISQILREKFGDKYPFPKRKLPKFLVWLVGPSVGMSRKFVNRNIGKPLRFDHSKSKNELGINYRSIETTVTDHMNQLLSDGIIKEY